MEACMSDTVREPGISVTMTLPEWNIVFQAVCEAPLPLRLTQGVAGKLQQQIVMRQRMNGAQQLPNHVPEEAMP
jgi:hypothetical protein